METHFTPTKRHKGDENHQRQIVQTTNTDQIDENVISDNDNSSSSSISNLLTEADKALQESNKRHIKPVVEESKLGIELFIGDTKNQFHGLIKTRYADFIVHEIDLGGNVAKLTNLEPPIEEEVGNSLKLEDLFERKILVCLSNVNSGILESYKIDVTGLDKDTRTSIHHAIRDSYDRLESSTVSDTDLVPSQRNGKSETRASVIKNESEFKNVPKKSNNELPTSTGDENDADKKVEEKSKTGSDTSVDNSSSEAASKKVEEKKYILVTRRNKSSRHRNIWPRGRPDYTQFVLYKENKDTMDAIHNLAVATNTKPSIFTYAGTKDKRAITSQWVSGWRVDPRRLIGAMRRFNKRPYIKVGNFSFKKDPIRLGQLRANRFDLIIRHLVHNSGGQQVIEDAIHLLSDKGFVNYFGLQRFGTRTVQTHEIGLAILQSRWAKAIDLILSYRFDETFAQQEVNNLDTTSSQDKDNNNEIQIDQQQQQPQRPIETDGQKSVRQQGKYWTRGAEQHNACIDLWKSKQDAELVFKKFPHFRITNEGLIIKALSKATNDSNQDYCSAISSLPRNTRSMYVHSYQSLLWNKLATYRLKKHGFNVVVGDLVLPPEMNLSESSLDIMLTASVAGDDSGEIFSNNSSRNEDIKLEKVNSSENNDELATSSSDGKTKSDIAGAGSDLIDDIHSKISTVTEKDVDKYTIFDVVLPLPGSRIKICQNDVGLELERLLKEDGLTLDGFKAREKIFVSYGSYRKILVRPQNLTWNIKQYSNPRENLIETDLDELNRETSGKIDSDQRPSSPLKSDSCDEALTLSFDLPPSSYATMCLRELMKKPSTDFNNRF